jgi:hypothetical protein
MKEYTPEEIAKIKATLPADLQAALGSVDLMNELSIIVKEQRLHVDQAGTLADIVELTLSGLLRTREFISTLKEALPELSTNTVLGVAEQVSKRIFSKVQTSLKQIDQAEATRVGDSIEMKDADMGVPTVLAPAATVISPASTTSPEPKPTASPLPAVPIHELKATAAVSTQASTRDVSYVNTNPALKLVPDDLKSRINNDPYKEAI